MSITLSAFNLNSTTYSLCANDNVAWQNLIKSSGNYILNTNYPNASTITLTGTPLSSIPLSTLEWGVKNYQTSAISITANSDTIATILCAYDPLSLATSEIYIFNPYHLYIQQYRIDDRTLSATAYFQQISTNNIKNIDDNYILSWYTTPTTTNLISISSVSQDFTQNLEGISTSLSSLLLSTNLTDYRTYLITLSSPNALSVYSTNLVFNGPISLQTTETSTSYVKISAIQYELPLLPTIDLIWNITPHTNGVDIISGNDVGLLAFSTVYSAISADWVTLSTQNLSNSYNYTLSSYTGILSGTFRPYSNTTTDTVLSASVTTIEDNLVQHQYSLDVHGITNGVIHNLFEYDYLYWDNTSINSGVFAKKPNGTTYNFKDINTVASIEKLNLYIIPSTTTAYPRLCTYSFTVCALSGSTAAYATKYVNFDITMQEWLSSGIFNPDFIIQHEPTTLGTIYRPLTSATYKITDNSILPPSSIGNLIYIFDDGETSVSYNTITGYTPIVVEHTFNGSVPCVCSINLTVEASAANYSGYVTRDAITKNIIFADFPIASSFIIYPEYTWTGTEWGLVVNSKGTNSGEILSANVALSAYSFGHTENFFVSSDDTKATQYVWSVQNTINNSDQTITTVMSPTGWLSVVAPAGTTTHSVCAALYNATLPITMPTYYFDSPEGTRYPNFSTTFDTPTAAHRKHINFYGVDGTGLLPIIKNIQTNPAGIPSNVYLTGGYDYDGSVTNYTPFDFYVGAFSFILSSNYFTTEKTATILGDTSTTTVAINVDDIGNNPLSIPKDEINNIDIIPNIGIRPNLRVAHPSALIWNFTNTSLSSYDNKQTLVVYPVMPLVYIPNKYVLTGTNVKYENLANCFSGIQAFIWNDGYNEQTITTCSPYNTSYEYQGTIDLTLTTQFSAYEGVLELENTFKNIINVDPNYPTYDSNINRNYGVSRLTLPHDLEDISIGTNDWLTADTFNNTITKLYDNLTYLQYVSQLYDVPPTEYYGWLGTSQYSNSSKHFRWYVNSPNINYAYNTPNIAIDDKFTTLKDVYVQNNIMYVSNGTNVSVLSSNYNGTTLGTINYKTIGDGFTNIKAIKLDSDNRIYLLDTIDENNPLNGSKNRIIVFNFNEDSGEWTLLHGWGGLGGPSARTKFCNPNDIYIDKLNNIWVADTGNKVVKQFTRTGSWLQTINCDLFNEEAPLSMVLDENDNVHVLTSSKVIQFTNLGELVGFISLNNSGAKTIRECKDNGFAYICYSDKIVKYMYTEKTQAIFANNDFLNYTENYQNVYHDEFRNLYVVANNHILKYIDKLFIINLNQDITSKLWSLENCLVNKNEYIQDWVINRCLNRYWDNLEIYRKSILGKFAYKTVQTVTTTTTLSTVDQPIPENFDYCNEDWFYTNGQYVTTDTIFEYLVPVVRTFTIEEYKLLPYHKDEIYIGINELVTADVLLRPIKKLYECQQTLLELIT